MKINMLNMDTDEVEVREVDINNPESIMDFIMETRESYNLSEDDTEKLFDDIFRTDDNFDPYEGISKEELELYNSVSPGLSMTPVGEA